MKSLKNATDQGQRPTSPSSTFMTLFGNVYVLLVIAIVIKYLPIISIPFDWLESYFHEISHGLAALISGGNIVQIQLFPNGAGLCTTRGGSPFLISFAGYLGATLWAMLIFSLARSHDRVAKALNYLLLGFLVLSIVLWVRDLRTVLICLTLVGVFSLSAKIRHFGLLKAALKLIALSVVLNAIRSPLYLLEHGNIGDANALAEITLIPDVVWVLVWCCIGLYGLYRMLIATHKPGAKGH